MRNHVIVQRITPKRGKYLKLRARPVLGVVDRQIEREYGRGDDLGSHLSKMLLQIVDKLIPDDTHDGSGFELSSPGDRLNEAMVK